MSSIRLPNPTHAIGKPVYLKVAGAELTGIVTGYLIRPSNTLLYLVRWSDGAEGEHYELELSGDREYRSDDPS